MPLPSSVPSPVHAVGLPSRAGDVGTEEVEAALFAELDRLPDRLAEPCRRIAAAGGKRLRVRLTLAAGACGGAPSTDRLVGAAVAVELLHLATLVHDDLLDGAATRRGVPTVNAREGVATAVLAGDVLIGAAGRLAAGCGAEPGLLLQEALVDLCAGQALEEQNRYDVAVRADAVLAVAEKKTGTLLGLAGQLGALAGGIADPAAVRALGAYGRAFGVCLQLLDDLLDVVSSEGLYGKPTGVDFAAGTVTLPAVRPLATDRELRGLLRPGLTGEERGRALALLRAGGGPADALRCAVEHARTAGEVLSGARLAGDRGTVRRLAALPAEHVRAQLELVLPGYRHLLEPVAARSA